MDEPTIPYTVQDLLVNRSTPKLGMVYHCASTPYTVFTPTGALVGAVLSPILFRSTPLLRVLASGGIMAGSIGMTIGLAGLAKTASKGEEASPPWNEGGIQNRIDGLSHNYKVRALDLGVWTGIVVAGGAVALFGLPKALRPGVVGVLQALSLGSTVGSLGGMAFIYTTLDRTPPLDYDIDDTNKD